MEPDKLLQTLTRMESKMETVERDLEELKQLFREDYRELEKRLGKAENAITALQSKLAVYAAIATLISSTIGGAIGYFIH